MPQKQICTPCVFALFLFSLVACDGGAGHSDTTEGVSAAAIERHITTLASDEFQGRATASLGYLRAADYVAEQFESMGLQAAGPETSFHQSVPLISARLLADETRLALLRDGATELLEIERDYVMQPDFLRQGVEFVASMVYVGFGVDAPGFEHDDYAAVDVRGKIVVLLHGAPAAFPRDERAYYASPQLKADSAAAHGAVGLLYVALTAEHEVESWARTVRRFRMPSMRWVEEGARPHGAHEQLFVSGGLSVGGTAKLFESERYTLDELVAAASAGESRSFDLSVRLDLLAVARQERVKSPNLIARLPGADADGDYVVVTAHLDHLGAVPVEPGDDGIHNGAYDNASGVAVLLEIAAALARNETPLRRSVLFVVTTGKEQGLLGADYFVHHPTVELARIAAVINLDTVLMHGPLTDLIAIGAEHSSLEESVKRAARQRALALHPDPISDRLLFTRGDHYPFVRMGIPALALVSGFDDGSAERLEQFREWRRTVYRTPSDDMAQTFDFEAGAEFARINLRIVADLANAETRPHWNVEDFFGKRFAAQD